MRHLTLFVVASLIVSVAVYIGLGYFVFKAKMSEDSLDVHSKIGTPHEIYDSQVGGGYQVGSLNESENVGMQVAHDASLVDPFAILPRSRTHLVPQTLEEFLSKIYPLDPSGPGFDETFSDVVNTCREIRKEISKLEDLAKSRRKTFVFKETGKSDVIHFDELYKPLEVLHPYFLKILEKWTREYLVTKIQKILSLKDVTQVDLVVWSTARYRGEQLALLRHARLQNISGPVAENSLHELGFAVDIDIYVTWRGEKVRLWNLAESKREDELVKIAKDFFSGEDPYLVRWLNDKPHVSVVPNLTVTNPKLIEVWGTGKDSLTAIYGRYMDSVLRRLNRSSGIQAIERTLRNSIGTGRYFGSS